MKIVWAVLLITLATALVACLIWVVNMPGDPAKRPEPAASALAGFTGPPLRIGLIPERDIFLQRKRYRALAGYLSERLKRPVELLTAKTYEAILQDFAEKKIEAAFLGSLVAVLAMDRLGARVLVKPELPGKVSTYHGVIFVRADSPIKRLEDLRGHSIGMVRTTTAAHLFPGCVMVKLGFWDKSNRPGVVWIGTHDEVVRNVVEGRVDVGAIKNLRLDAVVRARPDWKVRPLATGCCVPSNAMLVSREVPEDLAGRLSDILLGMDRDPRGREVFAKTGWARFVPCRAEDYVPVYDMIDCVGPAWGQIGLPGRPPLRPSTWPKYRQDKMKQCYVVSY